MPPVSKLDDLLPCTEDVPDSHSTSSLVLHILAYTAHSLYRVNLGVRESEAFSNHVILNQSHSFVLLRVRHWNFLSRI